MNACRKATRWSSVFAQKSAAPIVFAAARPTAPPIMAPSMLVTDALLEPDFEDDEQGRQASAKRSVGNPVRVERPEDDGRIGHRAKEQHTGKDEPGHDRNPPE